MFYILKFTNCVTFNKNTTLCNNSYLIVIIRFLDLIGILQKRIKNFKI